MTRKKTHAQPSEKTVEKIHATSLPNENEDLLLKYKKVFRYLPYVLVFIGSWIFSTFIYGDVFQRCVEESYITSDANAMKFLTDQEFGYFYVGGRYLLLLFHNVWLGGLFLSILMTAIAFLLDFAFRIPCSYRGVSAILPLILLGTFSSESVHLYYRSEPSLFIVQTFAALLAALLLALSLPTFIKTVTGNKKPAICKKVIPYGSLFPLIGFIGLSCYACNYQQNTILAAKMQNKLLKDDFIGMVEDGLKAEQPSKTVAAYYAIGLLQTDQLLDKLFDISFHYPEYVQKESDGSGETGIFASDCSFFTGLINTSYRTAMDQMVMTGPRLYYLKRMAICAIMNQEKQLAEKYLGIIEKVPFEKEFVDTYRPMVGHPELISQNSVLSRVAALKPLEHHFEQNYRNPTFIGYNLGILQGSNNALQPAMAASMYAKDLVKFTELAAQYKNVYGILPANVQEAIILMSKKDKSVIQYFTDVFRTPNGMPTMASNNVDAFMKDVQLYYQNKYKNASTWIEEMTKDLKGGVKEELRQHLYKTWKGHYVYYYYCENLVNPDNQKDNKGKGAVN